MAKTSKSPSKAPQPPKGKTKAPNIGKTPATKKSTQKGITDSVVKKQVKVQAQVKAKQGTTQSNKRTPFNSANRDKAIEEILERLQEGESLRDILPKKGLPERLPSMSQFMNWLNEDSDRGRALVEQYARAREAWAEIQNEEMEQIAKDCKTMVDVQKARLIIGVKQWDLSKRFPRRFGDKVDVTSGGEKISSEKITPEAARAFVKSLLEEF